MKKQILNLLLVLTPMFNFAQNIHEQVLKTEIKRVKLFLTAGEMTHETPVKLVKGRNKIIFSGISAFADPRTIQFTGSGNFRLVSISTEMDFLAAEQWNPRIKTLADSLEQLKDRYQLNVDLLSSYQAELGILNTNKDLKGQNTLTIDQIKAAGEYYRTRTFEINKTITKIKKEQEVLSIKINEARFQLTELNYTENQRSNQVIVLIDVDNNTDISGVLKYLVSDCGWAATYDLSASDLNQPINLKYKAQVYNNTGNDWKNVGLTLSTSDPLLSAASPILNPFYLRAGEQADYTKKSNFQPIQQKTELRNDVMNEINMANQRAYDNYVLDQKASDVFSSDRAGFKNEGKKVSTVAMKQIEISDLNVEFLIPHPFSCPTDAKPYIVEIKEINMPATFTHVSIPKLDQGSFLLANIVGWQDLDLIPGPTNVYFAGNYVGVSEINTNNVDDTLSLSFGRDSKIQVLRKLKSEMSTKKISGSTKKDTYFYDIQVRNNRTVPVKINVFDQIPLSTSSEITVTVETVGTGKKNDLTGEVSYMVTLQPGESVNLELGYSVKYPKNAKISTRTYRTISCPSF
ncbi:DUF4139 domain-containing protein [Fluviicola taffensis]|uniref:DUF4139 domain-containing protein n=1 Tax=Fluviicola taffensis (strain DSM 16823 / NCIMB 13979 / RW262) TaxID=755732 RepID=F2IB34_FLUTR|nr:DUF4139 domain-containing protein [Fluviicola taffensis]AEA42117.1 Conserved hypothetical protein CHP02231 [Fluviicola taffensis DSM 16823]